VLLAYPHGFCAGVDRAIDVVERALDEYGAPVYVRGEIIHSGHVIDEPDCDAVLIAGARNSSNSNRLVEVARAQGTDAYLVPEVEVLDPAWLEGAGMVGVGAGASAPKRLVDAILARLAELGYGDVSSHVETTEDVHFPLPRWPT
jgi:4-hydroxy-3-methylbut-2-enyl diphosphate reductase IspH